MAAVPELPLGQMVFFRLAKVSGGLVLFLFSYFWGCRGKHVDKGKPGKEDLRPSESLCQHSTPKVIYKIESPRTGRRLCHEWRAGLQRGIKGKE